MWQDLSITHPSQLGSFENEALENEDRSTKHPNLENEAPKTRKRSTLDRKRSTQNSKTKTPKSQKRSTQNLKTKHPRLKTKHPKLKNEAPFLENEDPKISKTKYSNLENEAPKTWNHCNVGCTSCMTQSESGGGSRCVRTSKGPQNPSQGFIRACQLFNWTFLDGI